MNRSCILFALLVASLVPPVHGWGQGLPAGLGTLRETKPVRSLHELRQAGVVRQKWDLSCGAAALSTILTYDLGAPVSESQVVVWILRRTDPVKIRARGGFSLLDLKRFAKSRGFESEGYAGLTVEELSSMNRAAIVATQVKGFNHFMVFRGLIGGRVVLADPAFGTTTMALEQFQEIWARGIAFMVLPRNSAPLPDTLQPKRTDLLVVDHSSVFRNIVDVSIARPVRR